MRRYYQVRWCIVGLLLMGLPVSGTVFARQGTVTGDLKVWHRVTVTFEGPHAAEDAVENPFLDYRLVVTFRHGARTFDVPGFFAADGDAAETGASAGNRWRVHFSPDVPGAWTYTASFRTGPGVALDPDPFAGTPTAFDGAAGRFDVGLSDAAEPDFRASGRLQYVGERYLRHAGTGAYFLKGGAGSPENLLAYHDFDGTYDNGGPEQPSLDDGLHRYAPHVVDWRPGDPTWRDGRGKGLIGGLNYLAGKGMNTIYFLVMNVDGDGDDVWPWTGPTTRDRFDVSKLAQWEVVFSHMDALGIAMNVFTQETENDTLFDGGELGQARKLYYRELVARFAHHLGVTWNLGEENNNTTAQRKAFAAYIRDLDPYDHPIVVHNHVHLLPETYDPLLGFVPITGTSFQIANPAEVHLRTLQYVDASHAKGHPWVVNLDENGHYTTGAMPDGPEDNHDALRHHVLWGNLMAGGGGVEWYFGYQYPHADLNLEDWRSRDALWDDTRHALQFFRTYLPFPEMQHHDALTWDADDYVLARPGRVYALYLPAGGSPVLELKDYPYPFSVHWYDPRAGGELQAGTVTTVRGGSPTVALGAPPHTPDRDWAVLVRRVDQDQ